MSSPVVSEPMGGAGLQQDPGLKVGGGRGGQGLGSWPMLPELWAL